MNTKTWTRRTAALALALSAGWMALGATAQTPPPIEAPAGTYAMDKTHASMTWRIRHMGLSNYTARFKRFDVSLRFDPVDFSRSSVEASVDVASVETDFASGDGRDFNAELRSESFFNVVRFPRATYTSSKVTRTGPRSMRVDGSFTLLGVSQPLSLDVVLNGSMKSHPFAKVPALGFTATAQVPRLAFGLNPPPVQQGVGDKVDIAIEAEFVQVPH